MKDGPSGINLPATYQGPAPVSHMPLGIQLEEGHKTI